MSPNSRSTAKNKVNNDPVDELRRRSRRRLVGSIALFLAAIIIVPALVENEPVQTPSDVELIVPERPSAETPPEAPPAVASKPVLEAPKAAQDKAVASAPVAPAVQPEPMPKQEIKPDSKLENKLEGKPEAKVESTPAPKVEPPVTAKPAEDPIAAFAKTEVYWVQVTAVSDKARADSLRQELNSKGFQAKTESTTTPNGTVYRVRVGPLTGQGAADDTKNSLDNAGYSGRVVQ